MEFFLELDRLLGDYPAPDPVQLLREKENDLADMNIVKDLEQLLEDKPTPDPLQFLQEEVDPLEERDVVEQLRGFLSECFTPELEQSVRDEGGDVAEMALHPPEENPAATAPAALPQLDRHNLCPVLPAAPPVSCSSRKRKRPSQRDDEQPYVKKPPNAFMLFLKEQRPVVAAELGTTGSAAVNAEVGKRWKSLTKPQQQSYYDQARVEAELHQEKHPGWSSASNYRKKRRRVRTRAKTEAPTLPAGYITYYVIDSGQILPHPSFNPAGNV